MKSQEIQQLVETAEALADAARSATLPYFRSDLGVDNKDASGFDPVTIADRECETAMRDLLARVRPDDAILGEEHGYKPGTTGLTWILDPIDGTRAFMSGTPTWGVLIAVNNSDGPIVGVIDQPYIGERSVGGGGVAWANGPTGETNLATRVGRDLSEATIFTTFPEVGSHSEGKAFHELAARCRLTRYGMDCYAYALLAAGQIDLVVEAGLQAYDICAPIGVIEAAGGIVTDWTGGPAHDGGRVVAAANKQVHAAALEILSKAGD